MLYEVITLAQWLRRPEMTYADLSHQEEGLDEEVIRQVEIEVKYAGYIKRENERIAGSARLEHMPIPSGFEYDRLKSLRFEAREKLKKIVITSYSIHYTKLYEMVCQSSQAR